jgi:hypothetical protein
VRRYAEGRRVQADPTLPNGKSTSVAIVEEDAVTVPSVVLEYSSAFDVFEGRSREVCATIARRERRSRVVWCQRPNDRLLASRRIRAENADGRDIRLDNLVY